MFKIISGDFEKTAIYVNGQIIESKTKTFVYNAENIRVLSDDEVKELLYNADYSNFSKLLEKSLKDTKTVCFEYKFTNGKSFIAVADLNTYHNIQKSGAKTVDEEKLTKKNNGCLIGIISVIIFFIFICAVTNENSTNNTSLTEPEMEVSNLHNCGRTDGISYFCGTVTNKSNIDVQSTYINFLYYDANHKIIGDTLQYITDLKAGQTKDFKTPYNINYADHVRFGRFQSTKY